MIVTNNLEPNKKLKQEQIAAMFKVNRMLLHKAFQMLENEILVENLSCCGFYVTKIDNAILLDAFECREALEGIAAQRAAQVINDHQLQDLKDLFSQFIGKMNNNIEKYIETKQNFHNSVLRISGNQMLQKFEVFKNVITQTFWRRLPRGTKETSPEHLAIIDNIALGDALLFGKTNAQALSPNTTIGKKIT